MKHCVYVIFVLFAFLAFSDASAGSPASKKYSPAFIVSTTTSPAPADYQQPIASLENMLSSAAYTAVPHAHKPELNSAGRMQELYMGTAAVQLTDLAIIVFQNNQLLHIYPFHYFW